MSAHVIDGRRLARELKDRLAAEIKILAEELDCHYVAEHLPDGIEEADAVATVGKLDADPRISGILVLRPLPDHISEVAMYRALDPFKDIEAVHPVNAGLLALGRPR